MSKMLRTCVLVITIACTAQAGDMPFGLTSQIPDIAGEMQYGLTNQSPDTGIEILIALLSLF